MIRSGFFKGVAFAGMAVLAASAFAYEPDTHFQMTYVICQAIGFNAAEAFQIAAADEGMDDSPDCLANHGPLGGVIPNVRQEWLWHAFDNDGRMGTRGILDRKERMFHAAANAASKDQLVMLGVFLHYEQDTWAHRHHLTDNREHMEANHLSYDRWMTYNTPFGHAKDFHQPDRPPFDPVCALISLEDTMRYAQSFLVDVLHRPANPFLANYVVSQETTQAGWNRNGPYFHQLAINGAPGSPRRFLIDLIRTQIAAYDKSADPAWGLHETANLADTTRMADRLNVVCAQYARQLGTSAPIVVPRGDPHKLALQHQTTDGLIRMGMPAN